jgi:hypothetical protein
MVKGIAANDVMKLLYEFDGDLILLQEVSKDLFAKIKQAYSVNYA